MLSVASEKIYIFLEILLTHYIYSVDELRESFNKFDTDKSGFLTLDEIQAALRELGRRENASVIQTILQLKGLEDGITFTDFVRFFTSATFA